MNIQPLQDKVAIEPLQGGETKTASGLYVAESAEGGSKKQGIVVAVGPGLTSSCCGEGKCESARAMTVQVGDRVLYSWGDAIEHEGVNYEIVSESNILAIINK